MVLKSLGTALALSCLAALAMLGHVEAAKIAAPRWEQDTFWLSEMVMPPVTGFFCFLFAFPASLAVFWVLKMVRQSQS